MKVSESKFIIPHSHNETLEGEGDGMCTGVGLFNKFWMKVLKVAVGLPWPKLKRGFRV
jgi:hypothetical protein